MIRDKEIVTKYESHNKLIRIYQGGLCLGTDLVNTCTLTIGEAEKLVVQLQSVLNELKEVGRDD